MTPSHAPPAFDLAVVGAGPVGLATALALARENFSVALVGRIEARPDGRTVALLDGSVRFLDGLGAWAATRADAAPMAVMRLIDDTGSLFRPPPVSFGASEIGLEAFGWNIENRLLVGRLAEAARQIPALTLVETNVEAVTFAADGVVLGLGNGASLSVPLAVAADGRASRLRQAGGIESRAWAYRQEASTAILAHGRPHRDTSTEFHTRAGPFTLVPLPGQRSSLVWVTRPEEAARLAGLDDEAFAAAVEEQAQAMLGRMRVEGGRGRFPLSGLSVQRYTAHRLALVGETAHVLPPIGAQGLNLGLRDAASLRDALVAARGKGEPLGSDAALHRYAASRAADAALRIAAVDSLNRSLLADLLPVDFLRGAGLLALGRIGPLRRAVMREGVSPMVGRPRSARRP